MSNTTNMLRLRPTTFSPTIIRSVVQNSAGSSIYETNDMSLYSSTSIGNSGSFRYDPINSGLKSTQQLNVDWSVFSNHTFFNSAQVKTNAAFDKIIDRFPFDGTQEETEIFFDKMTGWEKYVYTQMPKNKGYLFFSGSSIATKGTYVTIVDGRGATFPSLSKITDNASILNPGSNSLSIECYFYAPLNSNGYQVLLQKVSGSSIVGTSGYQGITAIVSCSNLDPTYNLNFSIVSGSNSLVAITSPISKSIWNHISMVWDRSPEQQRALIYVNGVLNTTSSQAEIGNLNIDAAQFIIGSGSALNFSPSTTLTGAIDELKVWHSLRPIPTQDSSIRPEYAQPPLKLYMKFNEPSGSNTDLVIDHSGNGLHGVISDDAITIGVRNIPTASLFGPDPMTGENIINCPVLFPDHPDITSLQTILLTSASYYDTFNPNLITKLVPRHMFLEGQSHDALSTEDGEIISGILSGSTPNSSRLGSTQVLMSLLYIWATFFDEMKLYLDAFSSLNHVDYDPEDTIPDQFLQFLASKHGIVLPPLFVGTSINQYIYGDNLTETPGINDYSLQYIQNQIWRRILINLRDINSSKGTIHSIKSFIRAVGIDPDNNFRIREYGGPTHKSLKVSRERRTEVSTMASFVSGGLIVSPWLSASRIEPGFPEPRGTSSDNLLTSGSFTFEGIYYFPKGTTYNSQQNLCKFITDNGSDRYVTLTAVANSGSGVTLYANPTSNSSVGPVTASITGFDLMDGKVWNVAFGKIRNDQLGTISSSFFIRAERSMYGEILEEHTGSVFYDESMGDLFKGSVHYIEIGSGSIYPLGTLPITLNPLNLTEIFSGRLSQLRFWSKALTIDESREHSRNFKSLGVLDPTVNFNFENKKTGSFEKLRIDVSTDQQILTSSNVGSITLFDFSQNNFHMSGSVFPISSTIILPQRFYYSQISSKFDEGATNNKVRVRSYSNVENILNDEENYAQAAPLHELRPTDQPNDNNKFTIDFSVVDALNQDISCIFANLNEMDNALGNPNLLFSSDYPTLETLRNLYFNRLTQKMNVKGFFEFYKWFDSNIGSFISQLIPRRTNFLGTNFVIEPHMLERNKLEYHSEDMYLGDAMRHSQKQTILLQFFSCLMQKI